MPLQRKTKRGGLSIKDKSYIAKQHTKQSPEALASKLRRPVAIVERYISSLTGVDAEGYGELAERLELSAAWTQLKLQFTEGELDYFKNRYVYYMGQFARDEELPPTEELQVFNLITIEILINQTLEEQKISRDDMVRLRSLLVRERKGDPPDDKRIYELETQYETQRAASKLYSDRINTYYSKQSAILKELKSTREQRIKVLENTQSFASFLKKLTLEDGRLRLGEEAELHRLGLEEEYRRLSEPHKFADGFTDQPLLTPENVMENYDKTIPESYLQDLAQEGTPSG